MVQIAIIFSIALGHFILSQSGQLGQNPWIQVFSFLASMGLLFVTQQRWIHLSQFQVLCLSILIPCLYLAVPASDDLNRYVWEAKVSSAKLNPYELEPNSEKLSHLRDDFFWPMVNHPDLSAAYPPLSIKIFEYWSKVVNPILELLPLNSSNYPVNYWSIKLLMLCSFLISVWLAFLILKQKGIKPPRILLWSLNPFALYFLVGEAHLDILMITSLMAALYFFYSKKIRWTAFFLGLSICLKYFSVIALILFINNRWKLSHSLYFAIPFLSFLSYSHYFKSLIEFGTAYQFNGFLHSGIRNLFGLPGLFIAISLVLIILFFHAAVESSIEKNLLYTTLVLVCFLPTIHPWYICLSLPWLILHRSPSIWTLQITTFLFLMPMYTISYETKVWAELPQFSYLIWIPFLGVYIWEIFRTKKSTEVSFPPIKSIDILVPVHNEAQGLENFHKQLESAVAQLKHISFHITYIHSGAQDGCGEIASKLGLNWKTSPKPGRGYQLNHGLTFANSDLIFILHADTKFPPNIFQDITQQMNQNPHYYSGWCPMDFDHKQGLSLVRILNSFRANTLQISFGDQVQFFRQEAIKFYEKQSLALIPQMPLMEDVELSMKLKALGPTLKSVCPIQVSSRRWQNTNRWKNAFLIIKITAFYLFARRLGLAPSESDYFQKQYYGK